jgi:hypothetical protein
MKSWPVIALLVAGATVLGSTVLRESVANAAQIVGATIIGPLDANGNVAVHEQGTATVRVANAPDAPVEVHEINTPRNEATSHGNGASFALFGDPTRTEVIEYVSAICVGAPMERVEIWVGSGPHFDVPPSYVAAGESIASQVVRIYAKPGQLGNALVHQPNSEGEGHCELSLSGHLEG